jgi:hypothetical protein
MIRKILSAFFLLFCAACHTLPRTAIPAVPSPPDEAVADTPVFHETETPISTGKLITTSTSPSEENRLFPQAMDLIRAQLNYIAQSQDGLMWFGGGTGFSTFDGKNWKAFLLDSIIRGKRITAYALDQKGKLWLGIENEGLMSFDGKVWKHYTNQDGLVDNAVTALAFSEDGTLWVGTSDGISQFKGNHWISYPSIIDKKNIKLYGEKDFIRTMAVTPDQVVWFGLDWGDLVSFDGAQWITRTISTSVIDMAVGPDGSIWLIGGRGKIFQVKSGETITYENPALKEFPPFDIAVTREGKVLVGTWGGYQIARFDGKIWTTLGGENIVREKYPSKYGGMEFAGVFSIYEDRDGVLWFGTEEGAYQYHPKK